MCVVWVVIYGFFELEVYGGFGMFDDVDWSFEVFFDVLIVGIFVFVCV